MSLPCLHLVHYLPSRHGQDVHRFLARRMFMLPCGCVLALILNDSGFPWRK
jgi:hypothetical protein